MTYHIRGVRSFEAARASLWKGAVQFLQRLPVLALLALSLLLLVAQQGIAQLGIGFNRGETEPIKSSDGAPLHGLFHVAGIHRQAGDGGEYGLNVYCGDITQPRLSAALDIENFPRDNTVGGNSRPVDPSRYGDVPEENPGWGRGKTPCMPDHPNDTGQYNAEHEIFIPPEDGDGVRLDRDDFRPNRPEAMSAVVSKEIERDAGGKPLHIFSHPALIRSRQPVPAETFFVAKAGACFAGHPLILTAMPGEGPGLPAVTDSGGFTADVGNVPEPVVTLPAGPPGGSHFLDSEAQSAGIAEPGGGPTRHIASTNGAAQPLFREPAQPDLQRSRDAPECGRQGLTKHAAANASGRHASGWIGIQPKPPCRHPSFPCRSAARSV